MPRFHRRAESVLADGVFTTATSHPLPCEADLHRAMVQSEGRQMVAGVGLPRSPRKANWDSTVRCVRAAVISWAASMVNMGGYPNGTTFRTRVRSISPG